MSPAFEVVFFDLGDTLVYDKHPWEPLLKSADAALRASLEDAGYPLAPAAYGEFDTLFDLYYHRRQDNTKEETTVQLLRELMTAQDASPPEQVLRSAMEAMYAITQENWYPEKDAGPTLRKLRERGCRLGLISNAADDENVQALVDKAGLRDEFELILSSAACGIRKPDERIFHLAGIETVVLVQALLSIAFWQRVVAVRQDGAADREGDRHPILPVIGEALEGVDDIPVADWERSLGILRDETHSLSAIERYAGFMAEE